MSSLAPEHIAVETTNTVTSLNHKSEATTTDRKTGREKAKNNLAQGIGGDTISAAIGKTTGGARPGATASASDIRSAAGSRSFIVLDEIVERHVQSVRHVEGEEMRGEGRESGGNRKIGFSRETEKEILAKWVLEA